MTKALEQVKTPYVIRMDDDQLLTRNTRFEDQLSFLKRHQEIDLVSVLQFTAPRCRSLSVSVKEFMKDDMSIALKPLKIPHGTVIDESHTVYGKCPNVYITETEKLRSVGWDTNIRMLDHRFFFWKAAGVLASAVDHKRCVFHFSYPYDKNYGSYRSDFEADIRYIQNYIIEEASRQGKARISDIS